MSHHDLACITQGVRGGITVGFSLTQMARNIEEQQGLRCPKIETKLSILSVTYGEQRGTPL